MPHRRRSAGSSTHPPTATGFADKEGREQERGPVTPCSVAAARNYLLRRRNGTGITRPRQGGRLARGVPASMLVRSATPRARVRPPCILAGAAPPPNLPRPATLVPRSAAPHGSAVQPAPLRSAGPVPPADRKGRLAASGGDRPNTNQTPPLIVTTRRNFHDNSPNSCRTSLPAPE